MQRNEHLKGGPQPANVFSRNEAAEYLRLHVATIDRMRKRGELHAVTTNAHGRVLYTRAVLDAWLLEHMVAVILAAGVLGCIAAHDLTGIPCPLMEWFNDLGGG